MNLDLAAKQAFNFIKTNSPELLTGLAVVGVGATAYLAHRAGKARSERPETTGDTPVKRALNEVENNWDLYTPAVLVGAATVGAIVFSNRAGNKRTAVALAAYSMTEKAFTEYKKYVVDEVGEKKEKAIRDKAAADRVNKTYDSAAPVVVGDGNVLCHEAYTDRYFMCDAESLRRAVNVVNHRALTGGLTTCPLDDFYDEIGLPYTSNSGRVGWTADRLMDLELTAVKTADDKPCLSFTYNYISPL